MVPISLGLDFGTESVRVILVDANGKERGVAESAFKHGQITERLPFSGQPLPKHYALQWPGDWLESAEIATRQACSIAAVDPAEIVGIGIDFTSCTMLPTKRDGTPLCELERFRDTPLAWPKLWKHHGAIDQTERMNSIARDRNEEFLSRYGGIVGLEWFFPKMLETIENSPEVSDAAEVWLEAGDWFVWQLIGCDADVMPRSTCQAGYKALWSADSGYASQDYLAAVHPELAESAKNKLPGQMSSPGERAGLLTDEMAKRLGLPVGIAVSTATIDAHSAVPGVGAAESGTLVMVLGTSSCHMLNSTVGKSIPGVAGIVKGGMLPGLYGYETGQAAVGDAFAWLLNLLSLDSFDKLASDAMQLEPGADGVTCLDWMNGCRTPLMDGNLRGAFTGLALHHTGAHLYRALLEASGFGIRWIVELLLEGGVGVERLVATGGLAHHNPAVVQVYSDVLGRSIEVHPSKQGPAVGAAVLGMVAAGADKSGFQDVTAASRAMASVRENERRMVEPNHAAKDKYDALYSDYRELAEFARSQ